MEMMIELMHPTRLEKKANIRNNRPCSDMWLGSSRSCMATTASKGGLLNIRRHTLIVSKASSS
jgi:hypothetical protein